MSKWIFDMAWMCKQMGLRPRTVCECGVGPLDISIAKGFMGYCDRFLLIEPIARQADAAEKAFGVHVHRVAVGEKTGIATIVDNGGSSYLSGTWAPTPAGHLPAVEVPVVNFSSLDDGRIDVMNLDCEGQEWAVLRNMKSRPMLLSVEVWTGHPRHAEIFGWLKDNGYVERFSTGPTSETFIYSRP